MGGFIALLFGGRSLLEKVALGVLLASAIPASYGAGYVVGSWRAKVDHRAAEALAAEREAAKWLRIELETARAAAAKAADLVRDWEEAEAWNNAHTVELDARDNADRDPRIVFSAGFLRGLAAIR